MCSLLISLFIALQSVLPAGGETLVYELRYKLGIMNTKVATATITLDPDNWNGEEALRSDASVRVAPVFRLFLNDRYSAYLYFSMEEKKPLYYYNLNKKGHTECFYKEDAIRYQRWHNNDDPPSMLYIPNDGKTMEIFSLLFFLRDSKLAVGESMELKTYLFGDFRRCIVKHAGKDTQRFAGRTAELFVVDLPDRGLMENGSGNTVYVWRDSEGTRPVLGIEVPLSTGTMTANLDYE